MYSNYLYIQRSAEAAFLPSTISPSSFSLAPQVDPDPHSMRPVAFDYRLNSIPWIFLKTDPDRVFVNPISPKCLLPEISRNRFPNMMQTSPLWWRNKGWNLDLDEKERLWKASKLHLIHFAEFAGCSMRHQRKAASGCINIYYIYIYAYMYYVHYQYLWGGWTKASTRLFCQARKKNDI